MQSFEKALRAAQERHGKQIGHGYSKQQSELFDKLKGLPFWYSWDEQVHQSEYYRCKERGEYCCLNHAIGVPIKNDGHRPLYPFQREIVDALQQHKLLSILKSRSIGATEVCLRYMLWLCVRDDNQRGKNMAIITGIREDLAVELIRRFKNLLPPDAQGSTRENVAVVNGCRITAYPSKRVKDLRGMTDISFILCDEADHYDPADSEQLLPIIEALITKSDPTICLVSTPGPLNSLMHKLYKEPESTCRYHRLYIPYKKALGTLFSEEEIRRAMQQPNFSVEFDLQFGSFGVGNIFNVGDIETAVELGRRYTNPQFNPSAARVGYPVIDPDAQIHMIGLDPGFGGATGICMLQKKDNLLHVCAAEKYIQPDYDFIIRRVLELRERTQQMHKTRIYVDAANTSLIRSLKGCIPNERTDWEEQIDYLRKHKLLSRDDRELVHYMKVVPVAFNKHGNHMLEVLANYIQRHQIVIHPRFQDLISALQSARTIEGRASDFALDKSQMSLDLLDACRLALFNFEASPPPPPPARHQQEKGIEVTV